MINQAMILCAGLGTRLLPFTAKMPKPFLPLLGVTTIQYLLDQLQLAYVSEVVINLHHLSQVAKLALNELDLGTVRLIVSDESGGLLGSGGGLRQGYSLLKPQAFFWLNGDSLGDVSLQDLALHHERMRAEEGVLMTLALLPKEKCPLLNFRALQLDNKRNLVLGLGKDAVEGSALFTGIAVVEGEALDGLRPSQASDFASQVLLPLIAKKKVGFYLTEGPWFNIETPKLWWQTHLSWMDWLLKGDEAPSVVKHSWLKRALAQNHQLSKQVWISRRDWNCIPNPSLWVEDFFKTNPRGPLYLGSEPSDHDHSLVKFLTQNPVPSLLPQTILYGAPEQTAPIGPGIGFGGDFVAIRP